MAPGGAHSTLSETEFEPLAIIGVAGRFSQEASDADSFWDFLVQARQSSTPFPKDRMNQEAYYHPDAEHGGTVHAKRAHFFQEDPNAFDAAFFNVNKTEVVSLDPQHRLVMENVYHALENAGIPMERAVSSNTSVFVSGFNTDHSFYLNIDPETCLKHRGTGSDTSMISGRVSWFYDFKGPSVTVNTACSSSMVAFHLATQSLRLGDSDMAIVTGVNVISDWQFFMGMDYSGFLAAEGKCFTFDSRADGYARGEGVATVIVKSLEKALADGDTIRAVVRASALNHDGRTPGLSYPSGDAQERLIREAYAMAGLDPRDTWYVESHGTGTTAGDPIETRSISRGFQAADRENPVYIGALKPNIGHTEGGSGVSGLIKAIRILESGIIPPNVNFETVNPQILMDEWNIRFPLQAMPWPGDGLRRVSLDCFGLSGTNAHCILDDAHSYLSMKGLEGRHNTRALTPTADEVRRLVEGDDCVVEEPREYKGSISSDDQVPRIFLLSGSDESGPQRVATGLASYLGERSAAQADVGAQDLLDNLAYTLSEGRSRLRWNSCVIADSVPELITRLAAPSGIPRPVNSRGEPRIGFVFNGQGAQYPQMGKQLLGFAVFRQSLEAASNYMTTLGSPWHLLDEILADQPTSRIHEADVSQPACTAIQVGLVDLLLSWNIRPSRVIGHSSGEIAAAYSAGLVTREAAWNAAYHRGVVSASAVKRKKGAMLAVGLSIEALQPLLDEIHEQSTGELVIACYNSASNNTVSGDEHMISALQGMLEDRSIFCRRLKTRTAYHSAHMVEFADEYQRAMDASSEGYRVPQSSAVRMFSTSSTEVIHEGSIESRYWVTNLISPVNFTSALASMCRDADGIALDEILEIGPHSALQSAIKESISPPGSVTHRATLDRNDPTAVTLLNTVGALTVRGATVDLGAVNSAAKEPQLLVDLPPYPFNHEEKSIYDSRLNRFALHRPFPRHDLIGAPHPDSCDLRWAWRQILRVRENPWLKDHVIADNIVFPGAGYLAMAIEATRQVSKDSSITGFRLRDFSFKAMLVVPDTADGVEVSLTLVPTDESTLSTSPVWKKFVVSSYSLEHDEWTENCTGYITADIVCPPNPVDAHSREESRPGDWAPAQVGRQLCQKTLDIDAVVEQLKTVGLQFGPLFRNLCDVRMEGQSRGRMTAKINIPDVAACMPQGYIQPHLIHPVTLDAVLQGGIVSLCDYTDSTYARRGNVVASVKSLWVSADVPGQGQQQQLEYYGSLTPLTLDSYDFDSHVWDSQGNELISLRGGRLAPFQSTSAAGTEDSQLFHVLDWVPDAQYLSDSSLASVAQPRSVYEAEKLWFSELQLAAALLATDALRQLQDYQLAPSAPSALARFHQFLQKVVTDAEADRIPSLTSDAYLRHLLDPSVKQQLYDRVAEREPNGEVLVRMGCEIAAFIRQESDPLYVMFGNDDMMTRLYGCWMAMGPIPESLDQVLQSLRRSRSGLRILEVGAGTGSFTARVLQSLSPLGPDGKGQANCIGSYDFTDISPSFFEKAKARLPAWEHLLCYKRLDLDSDPLTQGVEPGSYDLILASNALHVTADLGQTLKHMHPLLKPGGKLIFLEGVRQDTHYTNLSFGALPGWWLGRESIREWSPYVSCERWNELLLESGYSGLDVSIPSAHFREFNQISIMVSTAILAPTESARRSVAVLIPDSQDGELNKQLLKQFVGNPAINELMILGPDQVGDVDWRETICVSLLEFKTPMLRDLDATAFDMVHRLLTTCNRLLWVTGAGDPGFDMAAGLLRTIRWERDALDLNLCTLQVSTESPSGETADAISKIVEYQFLTTDGQDGQGHAEYQLEHGNILTRRLVDNLPAIEAINSVFTDPIPVPMRFGDLDRPVKLQLGQAGSLDTLQWTTDSDLSRALGPTEIEIEIRAVGLNFRDLLTAMGEVPGSTIGGEAAGVVTAIGTDVTKLREGDRVAFFGDPNHEGVFRSRGRADQNLVVRIPDSVTFDEAASMSVIYTTVLYALGHVAHLSKGESVLIHAAAGGVGQAAIQYAQHVGARVIATVSTTEKKEHLMRRYGIPDDHILCSRDLTFVNGVNRLTNGNGVDVVLNSLAGEALRATWDCVAAFGRFVEIGKRDLQAGGNLNMSPFLRNVTFAGVDLLTVAAARPSVVAGLLEEMVELWTAGRINPPQPLTTIPYSQIETGLRALMNGKNMGKIIAVPDEEPIPVLPDSGPAYTFEADACYILVGGLGGIGRSIARWMASRGAKHLVIFRRGSELSAPAQETVSALAAMGCESHLFSVDTASPDRLAEVVRDIQTSLPPIRGCIDLAATWKDAVFENTTFESWQVPLQPKVHGSWNLHQLLSTPDTGFFVMVASAGGIIGNRSQANYNAGNTFRDGLARYRVAQGLHAVSIDLGPVLSVGFMAENRDYVKHSMGLGSPHREDQVLAIIEHVLDPQNIPTTTSCQLVCGLIGQSDFAKRGLPYPRPMEYPLFMNLQASTLGNTGVETVTQGHDTKRMLAVARTEQEAAQVILSGIQKKLSSVLCVQEDDIDPARSVRDNGVDSLIEMEFRTWVSKDLGASLSKADLSTKSVVELSAKVAGASTFTHFRS